GDAGRLRQILNNLVGNAIKFTERGEVVVEIGLAATPAAGSVDLHFAIRDTGIGIAHDKLQTVFRAFEQESPETARRYGGTGLGLTIARRLIGLMAGELTVASEKGRGSRFGFGARFDLPTRAAVEKPEPVALPGVRVLVVDDNAESRCLLTSWLSRWGRDVRAAADNGAALDRLRDGPPFAFVVLDGGRPDALLAKIRERAATRIVLLTPIEIAEALEPAAGVHAQLFKPL